MNRILMMVLLAVTMSPRVFGADHPLVQQLVGAGVSRDRIQRAVGHDDLEDLTPSDQVTLRQALAKMGVKPVAVANVASQPMLNPEKAARLATDVQEAEKNLDDRLKEAAQLCATLPDSFPPDLQRENLVVEKYIEVVRAMRAVNEHFAQKAPNILAEAQKHRELFRKGIDALSHAAGQHRNKSGKHFVDLAASERLIADGYGKKLVMADQLLADLDGQLTEVQQLSELLDAWESALLLMAPITKSGAISMEQRDALRHYFAAVEEAMRGFKTFAEKVRTATGSSETPQPAKHHEAA